MEEKEKIIIFGLGYFSRKLIEVLYPEWPIIGIDIKEEKIKNLKEKYPEAKFIVGDASSVLVWKSINFENVKHIVINIKDSDVSLEACRLAREVFNIEIPITIFLYDEEKEELFQDFKNINLFKPSQIIVNSILALIKRNYKIATNIGLGKGEIVEVEVSGKSHFTDRKLKHIKPSKWRVAAIYRNGELIIPTGDEKIQVGDKVVIIGDPKVLENVVNILKKGIPEFPLQFGSIVATVYADRFRKNIEELWYLYSNTRIKKIYLYPFKNFEISDKDKIFIYQKFGNAEIKNNISSLKKLIKIDNDLDIAFHVIPYNNLSFFEKFSIKYIFENAKKPFFISKGEFPYKEIKVLLNSPNPAVVLDIAIDIARMLKVDINSFYVATPKALRSEEEEQKLIEINNIILDFENIHKKKLNLKILEGNPVKKSLEYLNSSEDNNLLVMSYKKQHISIFNPSPQYLIAKKCKCSAFIIPAEEKNE
ncbi:NAD-binding protein [Hydrogenothermus marinus]|uniref:Trk K+ transport system NAD-binding subunit n=1 Tax=Hydrogenothermus marinus TaxID=133270 RepID=A0A3M0BJG1_9AQUI|nr:NAD-binding protein [Hydrogenothermus marinus]RMA97583.1 hypothetical protein CLV39_0200 [Hydrogenothermus marinus]